MSNWLGNPLDAVKGVGESILGSIKGVGESILGGIKTLGTALIGAYIAKNLLFGNKNKGGSSVVVHNASTPDLSSTPQSTQPVKIKKEKSSNKSNLVSPSTEGRKKAYQDISNLNSQAQTLSSKSQQLANSSSSSTGNIPPAIPLGKGSYKLDDLVNILIKRENANTEAIKELIKQVKSGNALSGITNQLLNKQTEISKNTAYGELEAALKNKQEIDKKIFEEGSANAQAAKEEQFAQMNELKQQRKLSESRKRKSAVTSGGGEGGGLGSIGSLFGSKLGKIIALFGIGKLLTSVFKDKGFGEKSPHKNRFDADYDPDKHGSPESKGQVAHINTIGHVGHEAGDEMQTLAAKGLIKTPLAMANSGVRMANRAIGFVESGKGLVTKLGDKLAPKALEEGIETASKAVITEGAKVAEKGVITGAKAAGKGVKTFFKSAAKKIPIVGAAIGAGFALKRFSEGDWKGGIWELASGLTSFIPPPFGTALGIAADIGLAARDIMNAKEAAESTNKLIDDMEQAKAEGKDVSAAESVIKAYGDADKLTDLEIINKNKDAARTLELQKLYENKEITRLEYENEISEIKYRCAKKLLDREKSGIEEDYQNKLKEITDNYNDTIKNIESSKNKKIQNAKTKYDTDCNYAYAHFTNEDERDAYIAKALETRDATISAAEEEEKSEKQKLDDEKNKNVKDLNTQKNEANYNTQQAHDTDEGVLLNKANEIIKQQRDYDDKAWYNPFTWFNSKPNENEFKASAKLIDTLHNEDLTDEQRKQAIEDFKNFDQKEKALETIKKSKEGPKTKTVYASGLGVGAGYQEMDYSSVPTQVELDKAKEYLKSIGLDEDGNPLPEGGEAEDEKNRAERVEEQMKLGNYRYVDNADSSNFDAASFSDFLGSLDSLDPSSSGEGVQPPDSPNISNVDNATKEVVRYMKGMVGKLTYSMKGPRDPKKGSADCSSTTRHAIMDVTGIDPGYDTNTQWNATDDSEFRVKGLKPGEPDKSKLEFGDLLYYARPTSDYTEGRRDRVGHVNMYAGTDGDGVHGSKGYMLSHGGPGRGPDFRELDSDKGRFIGAKRFITDKRLNEVKSKPNKRLAVYDPKKLKPSKGIEGEDNLSQNKNNKWTLKKNFNSTPIISELRNKTFEGESKDDKSSGSSSSANTNNSKTNNKANLYAPTTNNIGGHTFVTNNNTSNTYITQHSNCADTYGSA